MPIGSLDRRDSEFVGIILQARFNKEELERDLKSIEGLVIIPSQPVSLDI